MKRETGRMSKRSERGFWIGASLLICFISSGCSLPDSLSLPSTLLLPICQTDSCWLTPSVVVHSVPDSTQAPPFLCLLPNMLLYFTSLLSLPSSSLQFTRSESYRGPGSGFHENVRDVSVQFVLLPLLLAVFMFELPQIRNV